ncbi:MAG: hypothetical protein IIA09_18860, partial [Proteobacteria bacterium]|nr:hypothetical protein [Pseudomonadota bacterium]
DGNVRDSIVLIKNRIGRTGPEATVYAEAEWTVEFRVIASGTETVRTVAMQRSGSLDSIFFASVVSREIDVMGEAGFDWLGAAAEMAKGLPGGQILLGPLTKVRDERRQAQCNAELDELIRQNVTISEDVLAKLLNLECDVGEIAMTVTSLSLIINELRQSRIERRKPSEVKTLFSSAYPISVFPVILPKRIVNEEFLSLFPTLDDMAVLRECIMVSGIKKPEGKSAQEFIDVLTTSLVGCDLNSVTRFFTCLREKKPASQLLAFAVEYLSGKRAGAIPDGEGHGGG